MTTSTDSYTRPLVCKRCEKPFTANRDFQVACESCEPSGRGWAQSSQRGKSDDDFYDSAIGRMALSSACGLGLC